MARERLTFSRLPASGRTKKISVPRFVRKWDFKPPLRLLGRDFLREKMEKLGQRFRQFFYQRLFFHGVTISLAAPSARD
jgi:hypothetical protein